MNNDNERRLVIDDEDWEIFQRLMGDNLFKGLKITELFAICLIYGKKEGIRTPLNKNKTGRVRGSTMDNSSLKYLMMAIAVDETGGMEIITNKNDYFKISEEYAKTGISLLENDFINENNSKYFLIKLEDESLKYFDKNIDDS